MERAAEACSRLNMVCLEIIIVMREPGSYFRQIGSKFKNLQLHTNTTEHVLITHACGVQSEWEGSSWEQKIRAGGAGQWFVAMLQKRLWDGLSANSLSACRRAHTQSHASGTELFFLPFCFVDWHQDKNKVNTKRCLINYSVVQQWLWFDYE